MTGEGRVVLGVLRLIFGRSRKFALLYAKPERNDQGDPRILCSNLDLGGAKEMMIAAFRKVGKAEVVGPEKSNGN